MSNYFDEEETFTHTHNNKVSYSRYRTKLETKLETVDDKYTSLKNAKCRLLEKKYRDEHLSIIVAGIGIVCGLVLLLTWHYFLFLLLVCAISVFEYNTFCDTYYNTRLEVMNDLLKDMEHDRYHRCKKTKCNCKKESCQEQNEDVLELHKDACEEVEPESEMEDDEIDLTKEEE